MASFSFHFIFFELFFLCFMVFDYTNVNIEGKTYLDSQRIYLFSFAGWKFAFPPFHIRIPLFI